ncbi:MAG TPA: glutamate formimidoyltransferase [Syntrophales bacterium]|nr:glutamate formimidoyltransferase [Syntrophales bacterium]
MEKVLECVPNISEGRDPRKIGAVAGAVKSVPGVVLADVHSDYDHNRSVFTFLGRPEAVVEAALAAAATVVELLDLSCHDGVHPRIGALDVVPFVPLAGASMADAVAAAEGFGARFARRFGVPVFFYGEAARRRERVRLADLRRGGIEGLARRMVEGGWRPDVGPAFCHERCGAAAVGARGPLIAFNVNLASPDLALARAIARSIRETGGGMKGVQALGLFLESRRLAQVSMNITDHRLAPLRKVFLHVETAARDGGVEVLESELVGLAPAAALDGETARGIRLAGGFSPRRTIEYHLDMLFRT